MSPRKMMLLAVCLLALCCCTTPPPQPTCPGFPNPPGNLMVDPLPLQPLAADTKKLSTVLATVDTNYGICHGNAQQLIDLQEWITNQRNLKS